MYYVLCIIQVFVLYDTYIFLVNVIGHVTLHVYWLMPKNTTVRVLARNKIPIVDFWQQPRTGQFVFLNCYLWA
jgi:hypothetical protein